jgi:hypothetical protein
VGRNQNPFAAQRIEASMRVFLGIKIHNKVFSHSCLQPSTGC